MKKMLTIDDYIKFTDDMIETGVLDKNFHIIQYKDGCCLGVNGKSREFEDNALDRDDYVFWDDGGFAHTLIPDHTFGVAFDDNGDLTIQHNPALVPAPALNYPYSDDVGKDIISYAFEEVIKMCSREDRTRFAFVSGKNGKAPLQAWVGGKSSDLVSAFAALIRNSNKMAQMIHDAIQLVVDSDSPTDTSVS